MPRLRAGRRRARIWSVCYLHYRYLWRNVDCFIGRALQMVVRYPTVLDIGCGHQPYRPQFEPCRYIGVDRQAQDSSPQVLADAALLPFADDSMDIVMATQTLEHVADPAFAVGEFRRVLKPGGVLILTAPFYWPLHEEPFDYYRYTKYGLLHLLESHGFSVHEIRADGGDWAQMGLSFALRLNRRWWAPVRLGLNTIFVTLDRMFHSESLPTNYSVLAVCSDSVGWRPGAPGLVPAAVVEQGSET